MKLKLQYRRKQGPSSLRLDDTAELAAKIHIQELRKKKFSIGAEEPNPLTQDLHHAVTCLSAELYTKDVHFLMELIQNAEDNQYAEGVEPTLEFALTTEDITGCGATETLLVFNNEVGFSRQNMESICSVGRSTKKGKRNQGFIGEKGIGFKSVFLVTKQPHIISNGYKVKFNEEPDKDCGIGYIVPEWISDAAFIHKIRGVYGSKVLPATTIVLPLKKDKVTPVKVELSSLHPELLLFLTKLRRLYVHENSSDPLKADNMTSISIVSETNHVVLRDKEADSRVTHLSVKETVDSPEENCYYYIWRQTFAVTPEAKVGGREHVEKWTLSLAFPFGRRLKRGTSLVGVFAFLPTSMVTNFPFVIQADFLLASSRETIVFDSNWNKGILKCVPLAYVNAFNCCIKEGSPLFTVAQAFEFLPSHSSPFPELNKVRETICKKLSETSIVSCETFSGEMMFRKPAFAVRILPSFRAILLKMKEKGVCLAGISSMKDWPVQSSLDLDKYAASLAFLGVHHRHHWYVKCFSACKIVSQASSNMYIDLLYFVLCNVTYFTAKDIPLIKFKNGMDQVELCTVAHIKGGYKIQYSECPEVHSWLLKCNMAFGCPNKTFFLPNYTQSALIRHPKGNKVMNWLRSFAGVKSCSAVEYSFQLCNHISRQGDSDAVITFSHFLYHSKLKKFLSASDISSITRSMPTIDGAGCVRKQRTVTLVPELGSKWVKLLGPSNSLPENYVDIGEAYSAGGQFAGEGTPDKVLLSFLIVHADARDLPEILPPNLPLPVVSSKLTSEQSFLLLDWIRFHRTRGTIIPERFTESICSGKWMKTISGLDCPRNCTVPNETGKAILEMMKNVLTDFSIVDEEFYSDQIKLYTDELMFLGVRCGLNGVQEIVMDRLKHLAASAMNKEAAFSLLLFMGFLKERKMLDLQWLETISCGRWLKTFLGYAAPRDSVFLQSDAEAEAAVVVTTLHVLDVKFYGSKLAPFFDELKLVGLKSETEVYSLGAENLCFPENPVSLSSDCGFFILNCLRHMNPQASSLIEKIRCNRWLKTTIGFECPPSAILYRADWACLLKVVKVPIIDEEFYGIGILSYMDELRAIGVAVDAGDVLKIVVNELKTLLSSSAAPGHLIALLHCITEMKETESSILIDMCKSLSEEEILKTRHGYKKPKESILFNSKWASISLFVDLPLIDDCFYGIKLYGLREELKIIGAIRSFEEGATFVARGLGQPIETELLTAEGTLSLLDCLKILMADGDDHPCLHDLCDSMMKSELLRTSCGYRFPKDSILFHCDWKGILELTDAPFIDDEYYGADMSSYFDQLKVLGVKVDPIEVCSVLSQSLPLLAETSPIRRIYTFLKEFQWKPDSLGDVNLQIWIPVKEANREGKWVDSNLCVLHDKAHYFAPILYSLDAYYEDDLLPFFSAAFKVIIVPATSHYLQIWGLWESREPNQILDAECCFFWGYILKNWNLEIENMLKNKLVKVPAMLPNGSILLESKEHVFVSDNLWLKKMFMDAGDSPLFVWSPSSSMFCFVPPRKLCALYNALGVRKISESVKCSVTILQSSDQPNEVDIRKKLIVKGLIEIILGFLACKIHMPINQRHEAVKSLLRLSVFENNENIRVSYKLCVSVDRCLETEVVKLVHWDKQSQKLFVDGAFLRHQKAGAKLVNFFAAEVSEGLLPRESVNVVNDLRNLIQMGFLYEFEEQSVQFLLTRENIEVLVEDEEFLCAAFPLTEGLRASALSKRASSRQELLAPTTPNTSQRVKRRRLDEIGTLSAGNEKVKSNSIQASNKLSTKKKAADKAEAIKDLIKPKKPATAFFVFMEEFRKQYKLEHPQINSVVDVSKAGSEIWRAMSDLEKSPYVEMSEKKKAEYGKELEAYKKKLVECYEMCLKEEPRSDDNDENEGSKRKQPS